MKTELSQRLVELRAELARGQQHLDALDRQRQDVRDTLLRISGAIQVLEELTAQQATDPAAPEPFVQGNGRSKPVVEAA